MADLLQIENVTAGYAGNVVLEQVSMALPANTTAALLGRNGVGKTTLLATIMGLTRIESGRVSFDGHDLLKVPTHRRVELGIGYVPQEREIFQSLTVHENLKVATRDGAMDRRSHLRLVSAHRRSGAAISAISYRAANSRCWLSGAPWSATRRSCCSTSRLKAWRPSSSIRWSMLWKASDAKAQLAMILVEHHAEMALEFAERGRDSGSRSGGMAGHLRRVARRSRQARWHSSVSKKKCDSDRTTRRCRVSF